MDARPGTLLVASPNASFPPELGYFEGAVVLLLRVCGCHPSIFGIILNSPTTQTMAQHFDPESAAAYSAFVNHTVRIGGGVGPRWNTIHTFKTAGALEIVDGLYVGGAEGRPERVAREAVASGVLRHAAWPIETLNEEIAAGRARRGGVGEGGRGGGGGGRRRGEPPRRRRGGGARCVSGVMLMALVSRCL